MAVSIGSTTNNHDSESIGRFLRINPAERSRSEASLIITVELSFGSRLLYLDARHPLSCQEASPAIHCSIIDMACSVVESAVLASAKVTPL